MNNVRVLGYSSTTLLFPILNIRGSNRRGVVMKFIKNTRVVDYTGNTFRDIMVGSFIGKKGDNKWIGTYDTKEED
jgi:hypothetical protein